MAGYTPVFDTVFEGSLCGQYPDTAAWLFFLALCDKNGCVDKSPAYISSITGMPLDILQGCIERFMQPDPNSRTTDEDGRRIALIDSARPWGWRVINHGRYRAKARKKDYDDDRTLDGSDAERKRTERQALRSAAGPTPDSTKEGRPDLPEPIPIRPDASRPVPLSEAEASPEAEAEASKSAREAVPREALPESQIWEQVATLKAKFPKASSEDWLAAEKYARQIVDDGQATWSDLIAAVERYARCCRATGRLVMDPANFFSRRDRPWSQEWLVQTPKPNGSAAPAFRSKTADEIEREAAARGAHVLR